MLAEYFFWELVFSFLGPQDLIAVSGVCYSWWRLVFFVAPPRYCWDSTKQVPVAQIKTLLHHEAHNKLMCICVW